jgi:hypothetical protein
MAGTFFDYTPGKLEVRFEHGEHGDTINMYIKMHGAKITTTDCDDQFKKDDPIDHASPKLEFMVYMTSVWCPFADYISFLEAITTQVRECSFSWDAEGPDCAIKWSRKYRNQDGFLSVEWIGREEFEHRIHLETMQVVGELYQSFRSFVESKRYDPLRYERLTIGEVLFLGLGGQYSLEEISAHIKTLDTVEARKLIDSIFERGYRRNGVNKSNDSWPESLDELGQPIEFSRCLLLYGGRNHKNYDGFDVENSTVYVDDSWPNLDMVAREVYLVELFKGGTWGWFGANLREMRSTMIENYLAQ